MVKLSAFLYNKNFGNFKFDKKIHLTVDSKLKDMKKSCYQTKKPKKKEELFFGIKIKMDIII